MSEEDEPLNVNNKVSTNNDLKDANNINRNMPPTFSMDDT